MDFISRSIMSGIQGLHDHERGRFLVLTGARQCGKTTLARFTFPEHPILSFDAPTDRAIFEKMSPQDWIEQYPRAVIDEAQKLPHIFDTFKACYDRNPEVRYVFLGSSQILLIKRIRESLAGRCAIRELYPLDLTELILAFGGDFRTPSRLCQLLQSSAPPATMHELFAPDLATSESDAGARRAWDYLTRHGGMPAIVSSSWSDDDRFEWLRDYHATYLQRDLGDLARLDRLEPFVRAQRAAALRTAQTINFAELARLSEVSPPTARQFMQYLEISYQILLLPAWFRNPEKRLAKQPKLHFLDSGIRRAILQRRGDVEGAEFESAVVAEVCKQARSARMPVELHHLRTADRREVDLLVEREDGFFAIECKQSARVSNADFRHFRDLADILDKPLLLSLVVSNDPSPRAMFSEGGACWNVAAHQLFSGR
jgi:predicted AAA+ superfamily ATPase